MVIVNVTEFQVDLFFYPTASRGENKLKVSFKWRYLKKDAPVSFRTAE